MNKKRLFTDSSDQRRHLIKRLPILYALTKHAINNPFAKRKSSPEAALSLTCGPGPQ